MSPLLQRAGALYDASLEAQEAATLSALIKQGSIGRALLALRLAGLEEALGGGGRKLTG